MGKAAVYFLETRPQFLLLTPVCFLIGASIAYFNSGTVNFTYLIIAFIGALAAHVAVNVLNDYMDYKSGLDLKVDRTPFSGGSGILPASKLTPGGVLVLGLVSFIVTVVIGVYFIIVTGWGILWAGLPGLLLVAFYTQTITRYPLLCLLAPGLGFGPCMVLGTYYVLQGSYDLTAIAASIIPGLLISNLLLLNQFPDAEADREVGRRHLPVLIGKSRSARIYAVLAVGTYIWLVAAVLVGIMPVYALIALLPLPLVIKTVRGVQKNAVERDSLIPYLGLNVIFTLATPFLVGIGFLVARWQTFL